MHMAKFIDKRDHKQIKSHHQKIILKYGSIEEAIQRITIQTMELIENKPELMDDVFMINRKFEDFFLHEDRLESDKDRPIKREKRTSKVKQETVRDELNSNVKN